MRVTTYNGSVLKYNGAVLSYTPYAGAAPVFATASPLASVPLGSNLSRQLAVSGGSGAGAFSILTNDSVQPVSITSGGLVTRNAPSLGTITFTARYTDADSTFAPVDKAFTVAIVNAASATVAITGILYNQLLSGTVSVAATASGFPDSVLGVQFKLDDTNIGAEDTTSPYSASLNTTLYRNGEYTLRAIARSASVTKETALAIRIHNHITIGSTFRFDAVRRPFRCFEYPPEHSFDSHKYSDGGVSFSELGESPLLKWQIVYTGLSQDDAASFDEHFAVYRKTRSFSLVWKNGVTYDDVFYSAYEKNHEGHKSWIQERSIEFTKFP